MAQAAVFLAGTKKMINKAATNIWNRRSPIMMIICNVHPSMWMSVNRFCGIMIAMTMAVIPSPRMPRSNLTATTSA